MLELTLKIEGKKKTFKQKTVTARVMRQYFKFYEKMEQQEQTQSMSELETLDEMIVLVADTFLDPSVNFDNILDGLDADEIMTTLQTVFEQVAKLGASEKKTMAQA